MLKKISRKIENKFFTLEFNYHGTESISNIDYQEIEILINKVFLELKSFDIAYIIKAIRTIYRDFDELLLEVYLSNCNMKFGVQYIDKQLVSYIKEVFFDKDKENKVISKYQKDKEFIFISSGKCNLNDIKLLHDEFIGNLAKLEHVPSVYLTPNEIALCRAYKLFYGENPNFTENDIKDKFRLMTDILKQFSINLINPLLIPENGRIPILTLEKTIEEFYLLGKMNIDNYKDNAMEENTEKNIKLITENIKNSGIDINFLRKIIVATFYDLSSRTRFLLEDYSYYKDDIDNCLKLVKTINKDFKK